MFGIRRADEVIAPPAQTVSDAPFRLEFAPGLVFIEAEIRDQQSLEVFVASLKAMGALLPPDATPRPVIAPPEPTPPPATTPEPRVIDLTAVETTSPVPPAPVAETATGTASAVG